MGRVELGWTRWIYLSSLLSLQGRRTSGAPCHRPADGHLKPRLLGHLASSSPLLSWFAELVWTNKAKTEMAMTISWGVEPRIMLQKRAQE